MTTLYANRFEVVEVIGHGGLGAVYRAFDKETQKPVAIKVLRTEVVKSDPSIITRFQREAQVLSELDHPNIVRAISSGEENGQHYIVMEYLAGGTLRDLLKEKGSVEIPRLLEVSIDVSDALTRAHRKNIIHRDIKPSNIIFGADGTPHLSDFGIARLDEETRLTQAGDVLGSYHYLSPEACSGKSVDHRSDIWSLGVTMYEMLTGQTPFEGDSPGAVVNAVMNKPIPNALEMRPDAPVQLVHLIEFMMKRDPNQRVGSMRLVGAELENIIRILYTPTASIPITQLSESRFKTITPPPVGSSFTSTNTGSIPVAQPSTPSRQVSQILIGAFIAIAIMAAGIFIYGGLDNDTNNGGASDDELQEIVAVDPVGEDELMILVADFEPVDTEDRTVTRFVVDDLRRTFERSVPYLNSEIRVYPGVVTSRRQAQEVANFNQAPIIVWGNYTDADVNISVELGYVDDFTGIKIPIENVANAVNLQFRFPSDTEHFNVSQHVIAMLAVLHGANGNTFDSGAAFLALSEVGHSSQGVELDQSVATALHSYFDNYFDAPLEAVAAIDRAIQLDSLNPILYHFRGLAYQQAGDLEKADQDLETAGRVSSGAWYASDIVRAANALTEQEPERGIELISNVIDKNPDDWFIWWIRGNMYFLERDFEAAQADFQQSIDRDPQYNLPYITQAQVTVRFGEVDVARSYFATAVEKFSDPELTTRILVSTYGEQRTELSLYTYTLSAYGNFVIGQYNATIEDVSQAIEIAPELSDLYLLKGVAECSLGHNADAEESYTQGLEIDPDFAILYLMRAEVRGRQGDTAGAFQDFRAASETEVYEALQPYIESGLSGDLTCKDFLQN
ncbi:MAG: protein kinase [Chloroflexi bacterium]|nr:protein kinase [Chloroflexota bacterium]